MVHSSPTLPPLDTLETFARAARLGSFSAAAEEAGITHGAVSRQVGRLERWMGVRLFEREARGVALTPEGMRFFARAEEALTLLGSTTERWSPQRRSKVVVRLSVTPSIATLWLFPRLAELEGNDIHIEISLEHRLADFAEGTDLAIRCGKGPWAGVRAETLWHEHIFPIAAPALAEKLEGRSDAQSLLDLPILHDSNVLGWKRWLAEEDIQYAPRGHDRRFEDYNVVLDACMAGLGIALARPPLANRALESGRLVRVSRRSIAHHVAFHLIGPMENLRAPAAELAKRLFASAGKDESAVQDFLAQGRRG
jgi:DNA-binding transcriptional LysR family regulator